MGTIKAIQTHYGDYHYRSRLEARWAVFFDFMGWRYRYEDEGFQLESGWYLPDFYFYDFGFYGEVKPCVLTDVELDKCKDLSCGMPVNNFPVDVLLLEDKPSLKVFRTVKFGEIAENVLLLSSDERYHPMFYSDDVLPESQFLFKTKQAIKFSNSYRFEHGEGLKNGK